MIRVELIKQGNVIYLISDDKIQEFEVYTMDLPFEVEHALEEILELAQGE